MVELNTLAVQGTPLAADLRRAAPGLTTLSRNLPDFNVSATDAVVSLGKTSVVGRRALLARPRRDRPARPGREELVLGRRQPREVPPRHRRPEPRRRDGHARQPTTPAARARPGYTGMEGLLNYLYYQTLAINQYDEIGHLLHFSIFEVGTGPCANYNAGRVRPRRPGPDGAAARRPQRSTAPPRPPTSSRRTAASPGSATTSPASTSDLEPAAVRPLGLPGGLRRPRALQPGGTRRFARGRVSRPPAAPAARRASRDRRRCRRGPTDGDPIRRPERLDRRRHRLDRHRGRPRLPTGDSPRRCPARARSDRRGPAARSTTSSTTSASGRTGRARPAAAPAPAAAANSDLLGYLFGS